MRFLISIFLASVFLISCDGYTLQANKKVVTPIEEVVADVDSLKAVELTGQQYGDNRYRLLLIYNNEIGANTIVLSNHEVKEYVFNLPNSDEVKNLTLDSIVETADGFKLHFNWGGGNFFYGRLFNFEFKEGEFYLVSMVKSSFTLASQAKGQLHEEMKPPVLIQKIDVRQFFVNELVPED